MSNYISAEISQENKAKVLDLAQQIRQLLSFGIKLTKEQKKSMNNVEDVRLPFVEKAIQYGLQEPKIVPPFIDLNEYAKDLGLYKDLSSIERELSSLAELVSDTRIAAGTDSYQAALSIYNSSKGAVKMGIPGTQTMVDEMSKLFNKQGPSNKSK